MWWPAHFLRHDIVFMTDLNTANVSAYTGILVTVIGFVVLLVYKKESRSQRTKVTGKG